jgi:Mg2+-importing ATPase
VAQLSIRRHLSRELTLLLAQFTSPIELILVGATVLSMLLGEVTDGFIILTIVVASGLLGFWQERRAGREIDALLAKVRIHADVIRDGVETEVAIDDVVVDDVVILRAGDVVPADARVIQARDLLIDESTLTGESFPVEKRADESMIFFGTHVASGTGTAIVTAISADTRFGTLVAEMEKRDVITRFERGLTAFGVMLLRAMVVLVAAIFVINVVLERPVVESLLFSLALAVGLTPQMLPAIVAVSLSTGARRMAAEQVVVKRLDAIEDFGTMDVLCTDKTGTLTTGVVRLDAALDAEGRASDEVLELARLNAGLQRGFTNPLDSAILGDANRPEPELRLDEIPYDFTRRRLSILVADAVPTLVTKGACREVFDVCNSVRIDSRDEPMTEWRSRLDEKVERLSTKGFRVLALATRDLPGRSTVSARDEERMLLRGFLTFADPVKPGAADAIRSLAELGVTVKMITGDNRHAAEHVAAAVGLPIDTILTGSMIGEWGDETLTSRVSTVSVFAEIDPLHKERIVSALRRVDHTVGYLGDGINDAAALHAADVGISVDSAVDVAKQSAAIVLLDKSLDVVVDGVRLGRRTFANTMKYVRVTISANFGNMLSVAAAAAFLPFLPLLPRQILLLNFLSDVPGTTIAFDAVDPEQIDRPHTWNLVGIRRFMIAFGLVSYGFDLTSFAVLYVVLDADTDLFRTGWFLVSTATELAAMLVLRSSRPFWRSRPGRGLLVSSGLVAAATIALPFTALASSFGFVAPTAAVLGLVATVTLGYVIVNELVKFRSPLFS